MPFDLVIKCLARNPQNTHRLCYVAAAFAKHFSENSSLKPVDQLLQTFIRHSGRHPDRGQTEQVALSILDEFADIARPVVLRQIV